MICRVCFKPSPNTKWHKKFCSVQCRERFHQLPRVVLHCTQCGRLIGDERGRYAETCSDRCYQDRQNRRQRVKRARSKRPIKQYARRARPYVRKQRLCVVCGFDFTQTEWAKTNAKTCQDPVCRRVRKQAYSKEYFQRPHVKEKMMRQMKEYAAAHKEELRERHHYWYQANRDGMMATQKSRLAQYKAAAIMVHDMLGVKVPGLVAAKVLRDLGIGEDPC